MLVGSCEVLSPVRARKHAQHALGASEQVRLSIVCLLAACRSTSACNYGRSGPIGQLRKVPSIIIVLPLLLCCRCAPLCGGAPGSCGSEGAWVAARQRWLVAACSAALLALLLWCSRCCRPRTTVTSPMRRSKSDLCNRSHSHTF